ncbi:MAG: exodeoxyribonuclease VII small subunit [Desulfurivibrio sp.]|jgi:exodeoxyribonuclease VII small subunit|nr:MAG: exodeoxyribonuclease VII small subunit [Desulfurivibrio sp.]
MAKKNFETALTRLEELAGELEKGDLTLEISLKKFDEGMKLVQFCSQKLDESQQQIDMLLNKNGSPTTVPFQVEEDEGPEEEA